MPEDPSTTILRLGSEDESKSMLINFESIENTMNSEAHGDPMAKTTELSTRSRTRRPIPPLGARDWMTPSETALLLGCSVATVHRLRRGLFPGTEPLPFQQYGRKVIFRKVSIAGWQERNEKGGLAA